MVSKPDQKKAPTILFSVWKKSPCPPNHKDGPCHLQVPGTATLGLKRLNHKENVGIF